MQPGMALVELPDFPERTPAQVAVPGISQTAMRDPIDAACGVEPRRDLVGQAFVLHESVLASRLYRLLVKTHGISVATFEARDLARHQGVFIAERRWIIFGPLAQLFTVRRQEVAPIGLVIGRGPLVERRHRQRGVVEVVEQIDLGRFPAKRRFRLARCRQSLGVVA